MKSLLTIAFLGVLAIVLILAQADKLPKRQETPNPVAVAQALASIEELPLPQAAKDTYCARVKNASEGHLPFLVDEARKSVVLPVDCRDCAIFRSKSTAPGETK